MEENKITEGSKSEQNETTNNDDNASKDRHKAKTPDIGASARPRIMIEKGQMYALKTKEKHLKSIYKNLLRRKDVIDKTSAFGENISTVRRLYTEWLMQYEEYLDARDSYKALLISPEDDTFCECDEILSFFKHAKEQWFLRTVPEQTISYIVNPKDSVSQASSMNRRNGSNSGSSRASMTSSKIRVEQEQAEIEMKMNALKKKRDIQLAKLNLEIEEEQLKLDTQLAISRAKYKILNDFEKGDNCSVKSSVKSPTNVSTNLRATAPTFVLQNKHNIFSQPTVVGHDPCSVNNVHMSTNQVQVPLLSDNVNQHTHYVCDQNISIQDQSPESQIALVVRQLKKPQSEIQKFHGDPLLYRRFMRQFKSKIVANTEDDEERLNYLEQYTGGEAYKIVSGYGYLEAKHGYSSALNELEERYGNNEVIANAFIKRALDWPTVKPDNAKALDEYGIFLAECNNAITSIEAVKTLEYPDNLKKLVRKLPYYFHDKWRNIVLHNRNVSEVVKFSQLVDFVKKEPKKANDPTYGKDAMRNEVSQVSPKGKPKRPMALSQKGTYATNIAESETTESVHRSDDALPSSDKRDITPSAFRQPCMHCDKSNHSLHNCENFKVQPYQDKIDFLRQKRLCFGCLKFGHYRRTCKNKATCQSCGGRHPTVCHSDEIIPRAFIRRNEMEQKDKGHTSASVQHSINWCNDTRVGEKNCTMAIIPVTVKMTNKATVVQTYAFLDPGSSASFCTESLLRQVGGSGKPLKLTLNTMGTTHTMKTLEVQRLEVGDLEMNNFITMPRVYTKDRLPVSKEHIPTTEDLKRWSHLQDIKLPKIDADIGLLIGNDVPDAYTPVSVRTGDRGSPHATKSILGWIAWNVLRESSQISTGNRRKPVTVNAVDVMEKQEMQELRHLSQRLQKSINLDYPEHIINDKKEHSQEDKQFLEKVNSSIKLIDGQYSICLPFKKDAGVFPDNKWMARQRLRGLKSKMAHNSKYCEDYNSFMTNIIKKGYAEPVPQEDLSRADGKVWYIPHHGVYHPRKPEKLRVVFDCSAQYQGVSLNSQLLQGPDLANNLLAVMLRFRQEKIGLMSDIESMFYQVHVPTVDCDCLRFLWWPDGNSDLEPISYRMVVHLFGAVSSPSCANAALQKTAEDNKSRFNPGVADVMQKNFYVDDCVKSVESESEAVDLVKDVTEMCQLGGFHLTKWTSNSRKVLQSVEESERSKEVRTLNLDCDPLPSDRVLGVHWSTDTDNIGFNIQVKDRPATKRGILSMVSSIYDPLGFASPFLLTGRIILQKLCKLGIGWDEEIPSDILCLWTRWTSDLPLLETIQLKRCVKPTDFDDVSSCQLHVFSDASEDGYGVCIYVRLTDDKGRCHCTLVLGKSRVAPLKRITIPRLELTAATVTVRLSRMVTNEMDYTFDQVYYWTDSMSVIRYLSNESARFHTFVANRIAIIRDGSEPHHWNFVESKSNPADCASRGLHADKFLQNSEWIQGPQFLWKAESEWPHFHEELRKLPEDDAEVKRVTASTIIADQQDTVQEMINRHSEWLKLKRALAWVLLAIQKFKACKSDHKILKDKERQERLKDTQIAIEFLQKAELVLVSHVQRKHFQDEINFLSCEKGNTQLFKRSPLRKLDPFIADGILRVGGRLRRAEVPFDVKHPAILPKESHLSQLYLEYVHQCVGHLGKNSMLVTLRQKYWMLGAASSIKKLVSRCVTCRKHQARALQQKMADLPIDRITPKQAPFSAVGMDYFGPIETKRGRSLVKRYGVVFTCLSTRAVHLEVACSLTTDSCINAIRRLIARRGPVNIIRSDNGTNLVGSERELREELRRFNQNKLHKSLQQKNVTWIFNPPSASHHGGVWERIIRMIRKILYSILHQQTVKLDDESLATLFCEVEAILNGRPITHVSGDCHDLEALTPNHLLLMRGGEVLPPGEFNSNDNYANRRWRQIQYLANIFWHRWTKEYLPLLQERQKWFHPQKNVRVNDIVMIVENAPRNSWSLGRVTDVNKDKMGLVRSVTLKTKSTSLVRPINKLCLLLEADSDVISA